MKKRSLGLLTAILMGIGCFDLRAQEPSSISPDKQWEYKCRPFGGLGQCAPVIVKAGSDDVEVYLDDELGISGPYAKQTEVIWAPDSKRFACNYSPPHPHRFTVAQVGFYQLQGDNWVMLQPPLADDTSSRLQLRQLGKGRLPKDFNPGQCSEDVDVLNVRSWPDANRAVVYAPCSSAEGETKAAFLFTLKFDKAGKWKVVTMQRVSKKELKEAEG